MTSGTALKIAIIGAGTVGTEAARAFLGLGAHVTLLDRDLAKLQAADARFEGRVVTLVSHPYNVERVCKYADVLVGAVLVPGERAPIVVTREMVRRMKPRSVIIDMSIDDGGCVETARPTARDHPTYVEEGVTHFCVTNMPGAVPQTSSQAICAAILPWVNKLASGQWRDNEALVRGINVEAGRLVHPALQGMKL